MMVCPALSGRFAHNHTSHSMHFKRVFLWHCRQCPRGARSLFARLMPTSRPSTLVAGTSYGACAVSDGQGSGSSSRCVKISSTNMFMNFRSGKCAEWDMDCCSLQEMNALFRTIMMMCVNTLTCHLNPSHGVEAEKTGQCYG